MKVCGTLYKKPCIVLLGITDGILPKFGALQDILLDREEVYFIVNVCRTIFYSDHFNAYVIQLLDTSVTVNQRE